MRRRRLDLPKRCANLCFGGRWRNRLFMAASHSLYALYVNTQGVAGVKPAPDQAQATPSRSNRFSEVAHRR